MNDHPSTCAVLLLWELMNTSWLE